MSGFDHNLAGITDEQGVKWNDASRQLVPADLLADDTFLIADDCSSLVFDEDCETILTKD